MRSKHIVFTYCALVIYTVLPLVCVYLASTIARLNGAQLNEGGANPCVILGFDVGKILYNLFLAGWLTLFTIPSGILGLIVFTLKLLLARSRRKYPGSNEGIDFIALVSIALSVMGFVLGPLASLPGIACGFASKNRILKYQELQGYKLAISGIIIGSIALVFYASMLFLKISRIGWS